MAYAVKNFPLWSCPPQQQARVRMRDATPAGTCNKGFRQQTVTSPPDASHLQLTAASNSPPAHHQLTSEASETDGGQG